MSFTIEESKINLKVSTTNLNPTLIFSLGIHFTDHGQMPISIEGELLLNQTRISYLNESFLSNSNEGFELNSSLKRLIENPQKKYFSINLEAELTKLGFEEIQQFREKRKGDVIFTIRLRIGYLGGNVLINNKHNSVYLNNQDWFPIMVPKKQTYFLKNQSNLTTGSYKISSSDWVNSYLPQLTKSNFLTLDIPIIPIEIENDEFRTRISEALNALEKMELERRKCEWKAVIQEARPVAELMRKKNEIKTLLENEGFQDLVIDDFFKMLDGLFNYTSKFIHPVRRDGSINIATAKREDAELVYAMSANLVNVIATKMMRQSL